MESNIFHLLNNFVEQQAISVLLGILGIAVTIFTVIYSFIYSDKNKLKDLTEKIKLGHDIDPVLAAEKCFVHDKLKRYKKWNYLIIFIIIFTITTLLLFICHYVFVDIIFLKQVAYIFIFFDFIISIIFLILYMCDYIKRIN